MANDELRPVPRTSSWATIHKKNESVTQAVSEAIKQQGDDFAAKLATRHRQIAALKSRASRLENILMSRGA